MKQWNIAQQNFQVVNYQGGVKSNLVRMKSDPEGKKYYPEGKKSYTQGMKSQKMSCKNEIIVVCIQTNLMITILRIALVNRYIYNCV